MLVRRGTRTPARSGQLDTLDRLAQDQGAEAAAGTLERVRVVMELPWTARAPERVDIEAAMAELEAAHAGRPEVKARIRRFLATPPVDLGGLDGGEPRRRVLPPGAFGAGWAAPRSSSPPPSTSCCACSLSTRGGSWTSRRSCGWSGPSARTPTRTWCASFRPQTSAASSATAPTAWPTSFNRRRLPHGGGARRVAVTSRRVLRRGAGNGRRRLDESPAATRSPPNSLASCPTPTRQRHPWSRRVVSPAPARGPARRPSITSRTTALGARTAAPVQITMRSISSTVTVSAVRS